jgi:hypothetical protein
MIIKITGYEFLKDTIESSIILSINNNDNTMLYNLKYPSNPLVDCEILSLNNKKIQVVLNKLTRIIRDEEYSDKTLNSLKKFKSWLINCSVNFEVLIISN